jgi:hypothetical protein
LTLLVDLVVMHRHDGSGAAKGRGAEEDSAIDER